MSKLKTQLMYLPRPAAKYPGCYPMYFEKKLPEILETENYIHLFSGMATTGTRVDISGEVTPSAIADVHALPFADNSFDGGMADPPYTKEFAENLYNTKYPKWGEWTNELARVVKSGGRIGIMQNYIVPRISKCVLEEIIVILLRIKQYPKIVTIQRKRCDRSAIPAAIDAWEREPILLQRIIDAEDRIIHLEEELKK